MRCTSHRYASHLMRGHLALLLWAEIPTAQAQGQGSYGGIADGFFSLVLTALLIGVAIVVIYVRSAHGNKAALGLLAVLVAGFGYLIIDSKLAGAKRREAYKKIERAFAEGCAETSRTIERTTTGDERVFIRLQGAEKVPDFLKSRLVPQADRVAKGIEVVTDMPTDVSNAILIDIEYSQNLVPGSYPEYEWYRTRYDLTARSLADGALIARTVDMQARSDFCLGELDEFLRQVLSRPAVLWGKDGGHRDNTKPVLPIAYVRAEYSQTTSGTYLRSAHIRDSFKEIKELLGTKNCSIRESTISSPVALCGDSPNDPVEVPLNDIVGLYPVGKSWLLAYRVHKGMTPLTSLRVEKRLADWRLARVWLANVVPPVGNVEGREHVEGFAMGGATMTATVYWDPKEDYGRVQYSNWYARRSVLRVPLPGFGE